MKKGGTKVEGKYSNWASNEPNDDRCKGAPGGENYGHFIGKNKNWGKPGFWNDYPNDIKTVIGGDVRDSPYSIDGYVVEYGGMPGDPTLKLSDNVQIKFKRPIDTNAHGDVHVETPDGLAYDFQQRGEFIIAQITDTTNQGEFVVQARLERWEEHPERPVSTITALAFNISGDKVEIYMKPKLSLYVNGVPTPFPTTDLHADNPDIIELPNDGAIGADLSGDHRIYYVYSPGTNALARVDVHNVYFDVGVSRNSDRRPIEGILGNLDGIWYNDMQLRGSGELIYTPTSSDDLKRFGDSWRVSAEESLFPDPLPSGDTAGTADPLTINDLDPAERAISEDICSAAGITDNLAFYNCTYDVTVTGDEGFVDSARSVQEQKESNPDNKELVAAVPDQGLPVSPAPAQVAATPEPTATLEPTATPEDTATPEPIATPESTTATPEATGSLFANPVVLGGLCLLLLLLLFIIFRALRRR